MYTNIRAFKDKTPKQKPETKKTVFSPAFRDAYNQLGAILKVNSVSDENTIFTRLTSMISVAREVSLRLLLADSKLTAISPETVIDFINRHREIYTCSLMFCSSGEAILAPSNISVDCLIRYNGEGIKQSITFNPSTHLFVRVIHDLFEQHEYFFPKMLFVEMLKSSPFISEDKNFTTNDFLRVLNIDAFDLVSKAFAAEPLLWVQRLDKQISDNRLVDFLTQKQLKWYTKEGWLAYPLELVTLNPTQKLPYENGSGLTILQAQLYELTGLAKAAKIDSRRTDPIVALLHEDPPTKEVLHDVALRLVECTRSNSLHANSITGPAQRIAYVLAADLNKQVIISSEMKTILIRNIVNVVSTDWPRFQSASSIKEKCLDNLTAEYGGLYPQELPRYHAFVESFFATAESLKKLFYIVPFNPLSPLAETDFLSNATLIPCLQTFQVMKRYVDKPLSAVELVTYAQIYNFVFDAAEKAYTHKKTAGKIKEFLEESGFRDESAFKVFKVAVRNKQALVAEYAEPGLRYGKIMNANPVWYQHFFKWIQWFFSTWSERHTLKPLLQKLEIEKNALSESIKKFKGVTSLESENSSTAKKKNNDLPDTQELAFSSADELLTLAYNLGLGEANSLNRIVIPLSLKELTFTSGGTNKKLFIYNSAKKGIGLAHIKFSFIQTLIRDGFITWSNVTNTYQNHKSKESEEVYSINVTTEGKKRAQQILTEKPD